MLTDKELSAIVQAWGNEPTQRTIVDLCRDVAKAQEAAERERMLTVAYRAAVQAGLDERLRDYFRARLKAMSNGA